MFDRIRKVFTKEGTVTRMPEETQLPVIRVGDGPVSEWATTQGFGFSADPNLAEEMRWLAMFDEMGWDSLPDAFWARYSVLSDRRETAPPWPGSIRNWLS
jgi:hypothetical protein